MILDIRKFLIIASNILKSIEIMRYIIFSGGSYLLQK